MRGRDGQADITGHNIGITPAYAGKRYSRPLQCTTKRDHPRVCGEENFKITGGQLVWGSPPRMRGRARKTWVGLPVTGITPAYAGKRASASPAPSVLWDHPRVCGEEAAYLRAVWVPRGSPPRMRGRELPFVGFEPHTGITPAYAGKSGLTLTVFLSVWDHPRVCGEERPWLAIAHNPAGSPPRMRGRGNVPGKELGATRITPAYAGKS